jgi:hypothetical protein
VADLPSGPIWTPPPTMRIKKKTVFLKTTDHIFQEYWVFGLCPSFCIPKNTEWICFCPQIRAWETPTLLVPLESYWKIQWLMLALSNGPESVGVSNSLTRVWKHIKFPKLCVLWCSLGYRTVDEVPKLSNPEFCTPSTAAIMIYLSYILLLGKWREDNYL